MSPTVLTEMFLNRGIRVHSIRIEMDDKKNSLQIQADIKAAHDAIAALGIAESEIKLTLDGDDEWGPAYGILIIAEQAIPEKELKLCGQSNKL